MWDCDNSKSNCRHDGRDAFLSPCLLSSLQRMRRVFKSILRAFLLTAISLWPAAYIGYRHYGSNTNKWRLSYTTLRQTLMCMSKIACRKWTDQNKACYVTVFIGTGVLTKNEVCAINQFALSSCSWRVRRVSCSLILKMKLAPPSLPRSSYVPSSFCFIL